MSIPEGLPAPLNLLVVAFQRWHQRLVDSWTAPLARLRARHPALEVWEIPTLSKGYRVWRRYIDGGMAAAIPDRTARRHTLTVYTAVDEFAAALELPDLSTIHLYLVDSGGLVVWSAAGGFDPETMSSLTRAVEEADADGTEDRFSSEPDPVK